MEVVPNIEIGNARCFSEFATSPLWEAAMSLVRDFSIDMSKLCICRCRNFAISQYLNPLAALVTNLPHPYKSLQQQSFLLKSYPGTSQAFIQSITVQKKILQCYTSELNISCTHLLKPTPSYLQNVHYVQTFSYLLISSHCSRQTHPSYFTSTRY